MLEVIQKVQHHGDAITEASAASLTIWSSRRPQASLAGALRASHSGAAYRER